MFKIFFMLKKFWNKSAETKCMQKYVWLLFKKFQTNKKREKFPVWWKKSRFYGINFDDLYHLNNIQEQQI